MGIKNEARLTSSLLARKGSAQPFSASDVFSLPPQTVVTPGAGMDGRAEGRRPNPTGWSSSPVTPSKSAEDTDASAPAVQPSEPEGPDASRETSKSPGSWTTQSIFSALKRTPGLHPAADGEAAASADGGMQEAPRKANGAGKPNRTAAAARDRVALTLRVDQDRHTRLRLLSAQTRRSSQDILLAALDSYIDSASEGMTFCDCLKPTAKCCKSG